MQPGELDNIDEESYCDKKDGEASEEVMQAKIFYVKGSLRYFMTESTGVNILEV